MKKFFSKNKPKKNNDKKVLIGFLLAFFILFSAIAPLKPVRAQIPLPVIETASLPVTVQTVKQSIWQVAAKVLKKAGSIAFQRTLSTALNKIAYDAATYIGSGGPGQKPLYVKEELGDYLTKIGDEAAGTFIESFVNNLNREGTDDCNASLNSCQENCNREYEDSQGDIGAAMERQETCLDACEAQSTSCASKNTSYYAKGGSAITTNVCRPSSIEAKMKIALGLTQYTRPQGPNCTASQMIANWENDITKKIEDLRDPNFINNIPGFLDPVSNDLGIYLIARTDLMNKAIIDTETSKAGFIAKQGWLDVRNIAGDQEGAPNQAERELEQAENLQNAQLGKVTGDILVDAANVFLNQLAITAFSDITKNISNALSSRGNIHWDNEDSAVSGSILGDTSDPNVMYGVGNVTEITSKLIEPQFDSQTNYNILSDLSVCPDKDNPGPNNCVIDSKFMQAISEKKTVAEALEGGFLNSDWQVTIDAKKDSYISSYSLRNISVLRKYRILPVGWETAANKASELGVKATLIDLLSCFDPNDEYREYSAEFNQRDQDWCRGLIDPNWVLKAPANYCGKEGIGAQILSKTVIPGADSGAYSTLSEVNLVRAEDYCADEQTCIKEKSDGSCEAYGYCNEERRVWNFGTDSCEPVYNTCQSFTNTANGSTAAYLKNTLDYAACDPDSSGCRQYSLSGAYSVSTGTISWNYSPTLYLNKNLKTCSAKDEGCTEFLRVKPTWGANLIMNSDLNAYDIDSNPPESDGWYISHSTDPLLVIDATVEPGGATGRVLKIMTEGPGGLLSNSAHSLLPANFQLLPGQSYTLSADVYLLEGDSLTLFAGSSATEGFSATMAEKNVWRHLSVTRSAGAGYNEGNFGLYVNSDEKAFNKFYVKNLKFEAGDWETAYRPYGTFKVYEKLLPPYLENVCYQDISSATKDYNLKSDAPAVCSNYARKCNKEEVGCEMYSTDGFSVSAQVENSDYCPSQCLGYDVYVAKAGYFNLAMAENLIPENAVSCTAAAAGCSEFTNLDAVAQGGEQKEYYTSLKQCIKPSPSDCATFYSWEGTTAGYQLRSYNLKKSGTTLIEPAVTSPELGDSGQPLCNVAIYNLPVNDPEYNPDCREFYNSAGQVSYHLASKTITCSDNCHSYRLSENNVDKNIRSATVCANQDGYWEAATASCYVCLNGGVWDSGHNACIYQAIPGEGQICRASDNGCREYNGSLGNNVRLLSYYDFESGLEGWSSDCDGSVAVANISNDRDGHSLVYSPTTCSAEIKVSSLVRSSTAYTVRFLARTGSANDVDLKIYFLNKETNARSYFNLNEEGVVVKGGGEWNIYTANLDMLDHAIGANEVFAIDSSGLLYLDDLTLSEITDRYYLIKNSSNIPDVCYYDIFDNYRGADYNLGCTRYIDRDGLAHNLHKFSSLCPASAVGCEQLIATQNYAPAASGIWNDANNNGVCDSGEGDCVYVPGDAALYAVYDPAKQCNAADLGCSRLGEAQGGETLTAWSDVFKLNNPNQYNQILCGLDAVGCEEWRNNDDSSFSYFKNPGSAVCVYRSAKDDPEAVGKAWYRVPVKRCDANGNKEIDGVEKGSKACLSDTDCGTAACLIDNNDYPCEVSYYKTIGTGGLGNRIPTPVNAVGLCDAASSGCSEYIDPLTQFAANLVVNSSYIENSSGRHDGWATTTDDTWNGADLADNQQLIGLDHNKLYSFTVSGSTVGAVTLDFLSEVRTLQADNNFSNPVNRLTFSGSNIQAIIFNSLNNFQALITGGTSTKDIKVKELAIGYQKQSEIDKTTCNGVVNFDNGCILFNERSISAGGNLSSLSSGWDAYATSGRAPQLCSSQTGSCNSNALIKVRPDRVCSKWLDCVTYGLDNDGERVCYALGECDRLDDKNECSNYVNASAVPQIHAFSKEDDKNATGYTLLGKYYLGGMKEVGIDTEAHFDFESRGISLGCNKSHTGTGGACAFESSLSSELLVLEPEGAPTDYPAHGRGYLKVPGQYNIFTMPIGSSVVVYGGQDYYINYLVNTKNSGTAARLRVIDAEDKSVLATFTDIADSGWERKIHKFRISTAGEHKINIALTSSSDEERFIYFDDINIEPVLKVGDYKTADGKDDEAKNYVVRDCRLYPEVGSLSCESYNDNVVRSGLYGYCLQYDAYNPGVCALWYPIDEIASSASAAKNSLGYKGKFPLYYCTEADGNFKLVKKVRVEKVDEGEESCGEMVDCAFSGEITGRVKCDITCYNNNNENKDESYAGDYYAYGDDAQCDLKCGSSETYKLLITSHRVCNKETVYRKYYCVPKESELLLEVESGKIKNLDDLGFADDADACNLEIPFSGWTKYEGWEKYDGFLNVDKYEKCTSADCTGVDEAKNYNPPVAIWYQGVEEEDELKFVSGPNDETFRIRCNRFTQLVDAAGNNKAWVGRTGIGTSANTTPTFFNYGGETKTESYSSDIIKYGRSREDIPFGAAVIPDGVDIADINEPIYLRNQYSAKNQEDILAGRPYGCSVDSSSNAHSGCANIGQCSGDPNVFCIYSSDSNSDYDINAKSCASGGYGTCQKLWQTPLVTLSAIDSDNYNILKTLFYKQYSHYEADNEGYKESVSSKYTWSSNRPRICGDSSGTSRTPSDAWCGVFPKVANLSLRSGSRALTAMKGTIPESGLYALSFTSTIDKEQEPLRQIVIAWNDDSIQAITGQDSRPQASQPHTFYHYFSKGDAYNIQVKVFDNWDYFGCSKSGAPLQCP